MLGKLSLDAVPWHEPIIMGTGAVVALGGLAVLALLTKFRLWGPLWRDWITSVDHKKIGVMYIVLALVMLLRGFADAIMMRTQQALAANDGAGFLPPHHYDQIFTAHGVIMIFFVATPFVLGLMNVIVPLQIGARDVAYPFVNSLSFWLSAFGGVLVMASMWIGDFAATGWVAYPPLSELGYSPTVGMDYYIWSLQISGLGTTLTGINFIVTILRMRAPSMGLMKMPVFTWTALITNILIVAVFPVLTATLALLTADRYLGMHFFTNELGGNAMMYINLIWVWGHPEVYILILPAFGAFSEIIATFSGKPLFGYKSMVYATSSIGVLRFFVWLHHFFTMGSGANVNAFFGIMTSDHLDPDRREAIQLAVHDVPRSHPLSFVGAVDGRLHGDLRGRRHDGRAARGAGRGLRAAQLAVPGGPLPQRHHWRRHLRLPRRHELLVPQGVRLHPERVLGEGRPSGAGWSATGSPSRRSTSWASRA